MKVQTIVRILLAIAILVPTCYLFFSMIGKPFFSKSSTQTQTQPQTIQDPAINAAYQACLDRANNLEAQQAIIDNAIKECDRLYKP